KVDASSRNVQVRASLRNPDRRLVPGMFANVRIQYGEKNALITLPQTAVTYNPFGDTVFVVSKNGVDDKGNPRQTVRHRFVKLGGARGAQVAGLSGIKAGEIVVSGGQMKLRNGTEVTINNSMLPPNNPNPNP